WVVSGGLVAAYTLQQNRAAPITSGDGAVAGLLAGLAGAVCHLILSVPIDILMAPIERGMLQRLGDIAVNMPPSLRDMIDRASTQRAQMGVGYVVIQRVVVFVLMLFVGSVFSTL